MSPRRQQARILFLRGWRRGGLGELDLQHLRGPEDEEVHSRVIEAHMTRRFSYYHLAGTLNGVYTSLLHRCGSWAGIWSS